MNPWPRQAELLQAVAANDSTAVRSGHKAGKSSGLAILALWWATTQPGGRVIFTAPSYRQVQKVLWREILALYNRAAARGRPLGGHAYKQADSGIRWPDGREIFGFSTTDPDRFSGLSGNMMFLLDEAEGIPDEIMEAVEGNRAGGFDIYDDDDPEAAKRTEKPAEIHGGKVVLTGNPTRTSGIFFRAFNDPAQRLQWTRLHISSIEAAEHQAATGTKLGNLATRPWVRKMREKYGEAHPVYAVRVLGDFPSQSQYSLISLAVVEKARERWEALYELLRENQQQLPEICPGEVEGADWLDLYVLLESARVRLLERMESYSKEDQTLIGSLQRPLWLGADAAWTGADDSVIAPRRGDFIYPLAVFHGLDGPALAKRAAQATVALRATPPTWNEIGQHWRQLPGEPQIAPPPRPERPRANFDAIGVGASAFQAAQQQHDDTYEANAVVVSTKSTDDESALLRDQVWCGVRDFLKTGGMLPPSEELVSELLAPETKEDARGRLKVSSKDEIKKKLPEGRSPDRADAVCLCVYQPPAREMVRTPWDQSRWR